MKAPLTRRFFLALALVAALALPATALWAAAGDRPALQSMLKVAKPLVTTVVPAEARQMLADGGWALVDVRSDTEWAAGHLPGAKHLDRGKLEFMVERAVPDKSTPVLVYCKAGARGTLAALTLQQMGYSKVRNLEGGFMGWQKAGYEVVK